MTTPRGLDAVKTATWDLHMKAERGGIIAAILAGRAAPLGVALFMRNLLPVYKILDVSRFGGPSLARSAAIEADMRLLAPDTTLPLLPEGRAYAEQVGQAGDRLAAHAYVRFLGDLNGGRIMQRRLVAAMGDIAHRLSFHQYPLVEDLAAFGQEYRRSLDQAVHQSNLDAIQQEAIIAFEMNIALSDAVDRFLNES